MAKQGILGERRARRAHVRDNGDDHVDRTLGDGLDTPGSVIAATWQKSMPQPLCTDGGTASSSAGVDAPPGSDANSPRRNGSVKSVIGCGGRIHESPSCSEARLKAMSGAPIMSGNMWLARPRSGWHGKDSSTMIQAAQRDQRG